MFNRQVIIITGGSSGIGKAVAERLVTKGAHIALVARDENKLRNTQQELRALAKSDQKVEIYLCDVSNSQAVQKTTQSIVEVIGLPDILINSAGILRECYFENQSIETFREIMDTNFYGTLNFIKSTLPYFKKKGSGRIINICSMAGLFGVFGYSGYCSSKHAVRGLTQTLRAELKPQNIKVQIVYPPETSTPMVDEVNKYRSIENRKIAESLPMLFTVDKVACAIVKGIERDQFEITPGFLPKVSNKFGIMFSPLANWVVDKRIKKYYVGPGRLT